MDRFVSYAQNWEDVRLRRLFADRPPGFFVDVGAAHPTAHSFTHWLSQQGWRGINVEPLPAFFALLEQQRPQDVNLNCVLGRESRGSVTSSEAPGQRGSSTGQPDVAAQSVTVVEHEVPVRTLAEILSAHAPADIEVLKVDAEGAEADVLAGNDWTRLRPRLVVVARTRPEEWEDDLLAAGYAAVADDGVNTWYVEEASRAWGVVLAPPVSVLDHFVPAELLEERGAVDLTALAAPAAADVRTRGAGGVARLRTLVVLSSSNQLYSGTGRVLFETLGRLAGTALDLELAIDDEDARNLGLCRRFADEHGLALHVGRAERVTGCPDAGNADLTALVASHHWDAVYAVSWANAATNGRLLEVIDDRPLAYLPLHQPVWTIPLDDEGRTVVRRIEEAMLRRADVVLCISPWERRAVAELVAPDLPHAAVMRPGVDLEHFAGASADRAPNLLFVGDHREPRKRFDRVVRVLEALHGRGHEVGLQVVGNESERAARAVPPGLRHAVRSLGFVDEPRLRRAYREAAVLLLLSEYEAFGLPVIEALASATPVVMSHQPAPESLFAGLEGMHFVDGDDAPGIAELIAEMLAEGPAVHVRVGQQHASLAEQFSWDTAAETTRRHLYAAWARRRRLSGDLTPVGPRR